jgi:CheY-like chemotaxis protein
VDDSKLMLKMYEMMLRSYPVVLASDGPEALSRVAEHPDIDVVLLDINMPTMSGLDVLDRLRADGTLDRLKVIIVSTDGHEHEIEKGLAAGAAAYIPKPFDSQRILAVIADLFKEAT